MQKQQEIWLEIKLPKKEDKTNETEEIYIPPEKKQHIIDDLKN